MTEPQREPGVYEAMQLQAATQRAMRDIYTERPDPLATIPADAREALADYLVAVHDLAAFDGPLHSDELVALAQAVDDAEKAADSIDAWGHLPTLAAALRGGGDA